MESYLPLVVPQATATVVDTVISATSRHIQDSVDRRQEDAQKLNHMQLVEHLREQPSHIAHDYEAQEVAYVKRHCSWFAIRLRDSELTVEPVTRFMMAVKKRLSPGSSMKVCWVRLQTGGHPRLTTRKPNGQQGDWLSIPLLKGGACSSKGLSPSWRQIAGLLGVQLTLDPSLHHHNNSRSSSNHNTSNSIVISSSGNSGNGNGSSSGGGGGGSNNYHHNLNLPNHGEFESLVLTLPMSNNNNDDDDNHLPIDAQPVAVPLPMAVLFSLLATAAELKCVPALQVSVNTTGNYSTMRVEDFADSTSTICTNFSRDLDKGVVFVVRSNWNFSAMLD